MQLSQPFLRPKTLWYAHNSLLVQIFTFPNGKRTFLISLIILRKWNIPFIKLCLKYDQPHFM